MSEKLQTMLERIAEQQEANRNALSNLIERQTQNEATITRLLQIMERLAPQVIENTDLSVTWVVMYKSVIWSSWKKVNSPS